MAKAATKQKQLPYFARVRTAGPGRPKGSTTNRIKFLRAASDTAIRAGVLPIEVLLHNMRFYHQKAEELLMDILEARKKKQLSEDHIIALAKVYQFRESAGKFAADAAPYVHARLSSIQVSGEVTQRHTLPDGLELAKAMEIYRDSLKGRSAPQMKTIEHHASANKEQG